MGIKPAVGQDYCALHIQVVSAHGTRPEATVAVTERTGRRFQKEQRPNQSVEFCELGFLPVTVTVGVPGCNQVTVSDVRLRWKEPRWLKVIWDAEFCQDERPKPPIPYCEVLFRIIEPDGTFVRHATVQFDDAKRSSLRTDSAGRARALINKDDGLYGSATASGHDSKRFSILCREPGKQEEFLTLTKK